MGSIGRCEIRSPAIGRAKTNFRGARGKARQHATAARARGTGFNLFGSNPHAALCKQVGAIRAKTVLEVAVGDGSRAIAVMGTLAKSGDPIRYFGIDQFELAGGAVSLKDFHRTLRAAGIRAQIFPEPVDRGLARFLHTIGMVDLVLLSEPAEILDDVRVRQLLTRISRPETTILYLQDETWVRLAARNSRRLPRPDPRSASFAAGVDKTREPSVNNWRRGH